MGYGSSKLNVTHTLAANLFGGYLNSALLADLTLEANSLVLTAKTFPVLGRAKDSFAEQAVALRSLSTVVDRLSLGYLTVRPRTYHLRGGKTYLNRIKRISFHKFYLHGIPDFIGVPSLL